MMSQARSAVARAYESARAVTRESTLRARADDQNNSYELDADDEPFEVDVETDTPVDAAPTGRAMTVRDRDDLAVPRPLRVAAGWSWRLLLVVAGFAAVLWALARLHSVVIPVAIALLLTALLEPAVGWLRRHGVHRTLAAVTC